MRVTIFGQNWLLKFVPKSRARGWFGLCGGPGEPRVITIESGHKPLLELEVLVHEVIHATSWPLDEKYVTQAAKDIAKILWRQGWRKTET